MAPTRLPNRANKASAPRRLFRAALWTAFVVALAGVALNWGIPWLGRRGDLNGIIESLVRSSLTVPITLENIDSEPLSQLTVTRLHSVTASARERFQFGARSISVHYDPVELLGGRIRLTLFEEPAVHINLDSDLSGITRVPELQTPAQKPAAPGTPGDRLLPFSIDETRVERGKLTLQLDGRQVSLEKLRVTLKNLGKLQGQSFLLSVEGLGGVIRAWGQLDIERNAQSLARYVFRNTSIVIADIDAAELLRWVAPGSLKTMWFESIVGQARGKIALEGSIEGAWPETVTISLATHASDFSTTLSEEVGFHQGSLGLHITAEILGDLEKVNFTVSTHGEGSFESTGKDSQRGELELSGYLERTASSNATAPGSFNDGNLIIAPSRILLDGAGELKFSGTVGSILGDAPVLDFDLEAVAIDGGLLWTRLPPALKKSLLGNFADVHARGRLNARARIAGPASSPRLDGELEILAATFGNNQAATVDGTLRADLKGFEYDSEKSTWSVARLRAESGPLSLSALIAAFGLRVEGASVDGTVQVVVDANDQSFPATSGGWQWHMEVATQARKCSVPSAGVDIAGLSGVIDVEASFFPSSRKLLAHFKAEASAQEILVEQFYTTLNDKPLELAAQATATWSRDGHLDTLSLNDVLVTNPVTGPLRATASFFQDEARENLLVDASLQTTNVPTPEAFAVFVREPLSISAPAFANATLQGRAALVVRLEGKATQPTLWGQLTLEEADLSVGNASFQGLALELPFDVGAATATASEPSGFLAVESFQIGKAAFGPARLEFRLAGGAYLTQPLVIAAHGGSMAIGPATIAPRSVPGPTAELSLELRGLQTWEIARAHDTVPFRGVIDAELNPVRLEGKSLKAVGTLRLQAFGGEVAFTDLTVNNLAEPYSDLRLGEGLITSLRLDRMGKAFRFGVMSGVLQGSVKNLELAGGELTTFAIDLATIPTPGVPQFLDRASIESIRRVLTGPLGAIEETFFSRFKFADFGFACTLDDGIFRLRGKYEENGKEYLMRARWYQVPQVNIINGRPDQAYDWKTIVSNLRRITERKQTP